MTNETTNTEQSRVAADCPNERLPNERLVMWVLELGFATGHADTEQDLLDEVGAQIKELQSKYHELLYGVTSKFSGEARHETALRYIRNAERHDNGTAKREAHNCGNKRQP